MPKVAANSCILALRFRQFGDVLATLDALRALKEVRPERSVVFVVDAAYHDVLRGEAYLDVLLGSPPRVNGWGGLVEFVKYVKRVRSLGPSVCLDFHSNARSAFLSLLSGARERVGFDVRIRKIAYTTVVPRAETENGRIVRRHSAASALALARRADPAVRAEAALASLNVTREAADHGRALLQGAGISAGEITRGLAVGLNPGKPYPAKAWPEDNFARLARELRERGKRVVILWGPGERETAERVQNLAGGAATVSPAVTLPELPGFLKNFGWIVTIDSGLKHLAVCARVPTVTLFGSTSPEEWHMGTKRDSYIWRGFSCSPCRRRECPFGAPCMSTILVEDVLREIDRIESTGEGESA